ncbi:TLDc domain-containing protein [Entamoeba marina]
MEKFISIKKIFHYKNDVELKQFNNLIDSLIKWSDKSNYTILFDSDLDGDGKDVLHHKVFNKKNLYFIHFDNENNVFGGYMNEVINNKNSYINDPNSFVFSLIRNGVITNKKYDIKNDQQLNAFDLQSDYDYLYWFGYENGKFDMVIPKIGYFSATSCIPNIYNYNEENQPLRDEKTYFTMKRILVLEMH